MVAAVETMAYAANGGVPWHGQGFPVSDDLTPVEMMDASKTNWTVSKSPLYIKNSEGFVKTEQTALVRDTDQKILSYVPDSWNPCQNETAFQFFHDFVKAGEMTMETAGSLCGGKRVWALAKANESFKLRFGNKTDEIENYLLFSNPHKFGCTITIDMTPTRVVCCNTLALALEKASANVVRWNHSRKFDPNMAKELLFNAHENLLEYKERAEFLASKRYKKNDVKEYFNDVFPSYSKVVPDNDNIHLSRNAELALETMNTQPGAKLGEGSWWQAYNCVTYLFDHKIGHSNDTRLNSVWFGQGKDRKVAALNKALDYAKAA